MSQIKIGWAETDITPDKKVYLSGQFAERISEYVEKQITVTALAIDAGQEHVIFCSCDLVGTDWNLVLGVRERIREKQTSIEPENIILSATHIHTGPGYGNTNRTTMGGRSSFSGYRETLTKYLLPGQKYVENITAEKNSNIATDEEIYTFLVEKIADVIIDAWENRKTGTYANAFGRAPVGMCRRTVYSDGTAQMWGDTNTAVFTELEGGNDSGIELLYVFDEKNQLSGVVVNLACPAQCVQHRTFISPDFWGEVKLLLRNRFGSNLYVLPQCSAAGDQCPVDLIRWVEPESDINDPNCERTNPPKRKADPSMFDIAGMKLTGRRIANEIIQVWEDGVEAERGEVPFMHRVVNMPLPLRRATLSDKKEAEKNISEYVKSVNGNVDYNDIARLQVHFGILDRWALQEKTECVEMEVHIIRLGRLAFATNPFELFLAYGNQIKARSLAEQTFLIQLANGYEGYLPTKTAEEHGHYSAFISSGLIGHEGGDLLVRQTLMHIKEMFEE